MATIKKAQPGIRKAKRQMRCYKDRGCFLGDIKIGNPLTKIKESIGKRKEAKEEERAKRTSSGYEDRMTRDFPGDVSPGGFPGDKGGDKNTKWKDTDSKFTRVQKNGGKTAKKAAVKKAIKKAAPKKAAVKKSSKKK